MDRVISTHLEILIRFSKNLLKSLILPEKTFF